MAADVRVPLDAIFEAFGVPATVTRPAPNDTPIETTAVWVGSLMDAVGYDLQRNERRRVLSLQRAAVPTLPRGTVIEAAELLGGLAKTWRVESTELEDAEHLRAVVIEAT